MGKPTPRRLAKGQTFSMQQGIDAMADHVRRGEDVSPHVMVGPVVQNPESSDGPKWYFAIGSGAGGESRFDSLGSPDKDIAEESRSAFVFNLIQRKAPVVVLHDFSDELEMVRWCNSIWPSAKTRGIFDAIEAERKSAQ